MRDIFISRPLTIFLIVVIGACSSNKSNDEQNYKDERSDIKTQNDQRITADTTSYFKVGQNLEDFKSHFNLFNAKCGSKLRIELFKTNLESDYNTFHCSLDKNLEIFGQLNKFDNSIHSINVTLTSYEANAVAISNFIIVIGDLLDYTNPKVDRMKLLADLKFSKNIDTNNFPTSIIRNGMEYTMLGNYHELSFIVSNPED